MMCETKIIQCDKCHFIDSKWLIKCEARSAGVPCFQFDMEICTPEVLDQACEYCSAIPLDGPGQPHAYFHFLDLENWPGRSPK